MKRTWWITLTIMLTILSLGAYATPTSQAAPAIQSTAAFANFFEPTTAMGILLTDIDAATFASNTAAAPEMTGDYLLMTSAWPDVGRPTLTALFATEENAIVETAKSLGDVRSGDANVADTRTMAAVVAPATHPDTYHFDAVEAAYADIGSSFVGSSLVASPAPGSSLIIGYAPAPVLAAA